MNKLIPKHLRKSPVKRFSLNERKQIYNVPKTGIKSVDDRAENRTKIKTPYLVYKQKRTRVGAASPEAQKEALKERLRILKKAGYYTGKIDGIWGKKSEAALAAYDRDNSKRNLSSSSLTGPQAYRRAAGRPEPKEFVVSEIPDHNVYEVITDENGKVIRTSTRTASKSELERVRKRDEERAKREFQVPEEERKDFARWLYESGKQYPIKNSHSAGITFVKNLLGIGDEAATFSDGMLRLAIALHLFDDNNITHKGDTTYHSLGYQPGTTSYKWNLINGIGDVNASISLGDKLGLHPANFTLGQFDLVETPSEYRVLDTYNFNPEGTEIVKNKINSGNASPYEKIRYFAGNFGANKDLKVDQSIPREKLFEWYLEYLNSK